ncbi:hypothetical protein R3I93_000240 [Phoxinus phoxinus]|uniref:Uncharacterized protein n=1 Tax=Phoxinus phoxinus TaxID=58324 RepID=A0AAN9DR90_9TELE
MLKSPESIPSRTGPSTSGTYITFPPIRLYQSETSRNPAVQAQPSLLCTSTEKDQEKVALDVPALEGVPQSTTVKHSSKEENQGIMAGLKFTLRSPESFDSRTGPSTSGIYQHAFNTMSIRQGHKLCSCQLDIIYVNYNYRGR